MLNGRAHQRVDQPLEHDLTRNRFRHFDHGREIEVLDGCLYRRCRIGDRLLGPDLRIELLKLSNLAVRAPAAIAGAGVSPVGGRNLLEAARRVKASGPLVGDRLIVDKALGVRRTHGFLIEVLRFENAARAFAQGAPQTVQLAKVDVVKTATGYRASKVIGETVVNDANETVGKVDDIIIGTDKMPYAVLSVGGFLGVGTKLVVLPYDSLSTTGSKLTMPGATKDALKALPEFKYASK